MSRGRSGTEKPKRENIHFIYLQQTCGDEGCTREPAWAMVEPRRHQFLCTPHARMQYGDEIIDAALKVATDFDRKSLTS